MAPTHAAGHTLGKGEHGVLVGMLGGEVSAAPLCEVVSNKKTLDLDLLEVARILAR